MKFAFQGSQSAAPATKSALRRAQSTAFTNKLHSAFPPSQPATPTKSALLGQSIAPDTTRDILYRNYVFLTP